MRRLVTVRCRRKGHVLAELAVTNDGRRVLRMCHHAILQIGRDGQVSQQPGVPSGEPLWHSGDWEARAASYPVTCACKRPHIVNTADIEAADAAGRPTVVAAPMR